MSDDNTTSPAPDAAPAGDGAARPSVPPPVQLLAQYVKDLSFENPNGFESVSNRQSSPQIQVFVDVRTNKLNDDRVEVVLNTRVDAKIDDKQVFLVELAYAGVAATANIPKEHVAPILYIEVPRLLFPFARAIIAQATQNGGFPPLLIQAIDFVDLFRRQIQAARDRMAATKGEAAAADPGTVSH